MKTRSGVTIRRRACVALSVLALIGAALSLTVGPALAVHDLDLFELDGNVAVDSAPADDWELLDDGAGDPSNDDDAKESVFIFDDGPDGIDDPDEINYLGGGSKDDLDINNWEWDTSPVPDKNDIMTAGAALYTYAGPEVCPPDVPSGDPSCTRPGDPIIYYFLDRFSGGVGDADVGFWFFEGTHSLVPSPGDPTKGTFSGVHALGDILVLSEFTIGGGVSTVNVFEWVGAGGSEGTLNLVFTGVDCEATIGPDAACATVNTPADGVVEPPWPYTDKEGTHDYANAAFFEGGLNTRMLGLDIGCGGTFLANTRASQSVDARLHDFAIGDFSLCRIEVEKTGDPLSKVGDTATYDFTITNTGAVTLYLDTITDDVLGDLEADAVAAGCGTLLADASCNFSVDYVVQPGDPDPLVNTVTVVYNSEAGLTGDSVSDTDEHSVNLFQPSVTIDKTGDDLGKVGDPVDYTITVENTSSADSPNLTCDITDPLLGIVKNVNLAPGDVDVTNAVRVVQEGDPDPLVNTASVTCTVDGFGNVLEASDDHSVNLFQPSVTIDKTGDDLGKIGDPVDYTITVENTSSADSPNLTCEITDPLLGIAVNVNLAPGEVHVINAVRVVQEGDPDPLVNTASVTCTVDGFGNVLEASDDHSVNLFQPAIAADKTGDTLSKVGDTVSYTITLSNNSSADTPPLDCTATDSLLGGLFAGELPPGDTVINLDRVVQAGDPDPLPNTVTLDCTVRDFGNRLQASDDHSVNLFQPSVAIDKTGDPLSKVGDEVSYTITVTNTSSADSPNLTCRITDPLLGIVKVVNLAPGAVDVTIAVREVQPGDPDPLVNTASVTCRVDGFGNVIGPVSDSHEVNLFQPSVSIAKDGDTLSKAGDDVTYNFTITNTSSGDSPNLILDSVTDTLLGDLTGNAIAAGCGSLTSGASCGFSVVRTVQEGDPDPLPNTVTVHFHPDGFPNDISASDDHSVDLVHPGLAVGKDCSPTSGHVGDTINYTCTVTNTGDVTLLKVSITDSLVGDLTGDPGCGASLAAGASCSINYSREIQPGDPDPLVNTVTAIYQVEGLPNLLEAAASCTVDIIPAEGCTPGFWQGGLGRTLWNEVNDPDWTAHGGTGTNPFIHTTLFNDFFEPHPDLAGLDMFDLVSSGGGPNPVRKAARSVVAAYLNASFGLDYPLTTTEIDQLWTEAVTGVDQNGDGDVITFEELHLMLAAFNQLGCPITSATS